MNGPVWHCTGRRHDSLGCLGATEAEANRERLKRYEAETPRHADDDAFAERWLRGMVVKHRARHAGMATALAYVTTVGERIAAQGPRLPAPVVRIRFNTDELMHGLEGIRDALDEWDTERYRK